MARVRLDNAQIPTWRVGSHPLYCALALFTVAIQMLLLAGWPAQVRALEPDPESGVVDCTAQQLWRHNPDLVKPADGVLCFEGYLSRFVPWHPKAASEPDAPVFGVPQWTLHRIDKPEAGMSAPEGRRRPRAWFTVPALRDEGLAPEDEHYRFSKRFRDRHANWYERGHLTQKYLAERTSESAGWFTHNLVNAVPQLARMNKGPWLALECLSGAWANRYKTVWVISGPVFLRDPPIEWLTSDVARRPFPVAVPDALFKIVVREGVDGVLEALAFIYAQDLPSYSKGPWPAADHLTTVTRLARITGLQFSDALKAADRRRPPGKRVWAVSKKDFDPGCKRFATEIQ